MQLKEVDKKLDMQGTIVFSKNDRIFQLSRINNRVYQCIIEKNEEQKSLLVLLGKEKYNSGTEELKFFQTSTDNAGRIVARVSLEEAIFKLLLGLVEVSSVSGLSLMVYNGSLLVKFRFHHTFTSGVSRILQQCVRLVHIVKEILIEPTEGIIAELDRRSQETPLSVLAVDLPLTLVNNEQSISILANGGIGEFAGIVSPTPSYKFLYYSPSEVGDSLTVVDRENHIYESRSNVEILGLITQLLRNAHIKPHLIAFRASGNSLRSYLFVEKEDAVRVISGGFKVVSRASVDVGLALAVDYSPDVWGLL